MLGACVDYAGPPPEQETESNQPSGTPPTSTPPATTPPPTAPSNDTPPSTPATDPSMNASEGESPEGDAEPISFEGDVHPILVARCGMCHEGVAPALPDHGAADLDVAFAATQGMSNDEPVYERILARCSGDDPNGMMPPGCAGPPGSSGGCITEDEFDILERWVEQGASR